MTLTKKLDPRKKMKTSIFKLAHQASFLNAHGSPRPSQLPPERRVP